MKGEKMEQIQNIQELHSWRVYSKVVGNRITLELPENSDLEEVEIIIIPKKRKRILEKKSRGEEWKKDFLTISQWAVSEDDIRIKSWSIPEF